MTELVYQNGAWAQSVAAAWLVRAGYEVYTGLMGQESCDLIAHRRGSNDLLRVEVKYGNRRPNGKLHVNVKDTSAYDLLLVVAPDGEVLENPTPDLCTGIHSVGRGRYDRNGCGEYA